MGKMKSVLLAPRSQTREVNEAEAARLLQTGSWCRVAGVAPISKGAAVQRKYRAHRKELGEKMFLVWLPEDVFDCLLALKRESESNAALVARLVRTLKIIL